MEEFNDELSKFVGLRELKQQLQKWAKGMLLDEKRRAMGHNLGLRKKPHMAFLGNPGTGKTTVARVLGKLLKSVGVLSSDKVIEVQRTDLVAEYLGQTGPKTRRKIEEAMGGILFVDEAYQLARKSAGDHVDYGVEAMEEIMSVLEDRELVVVFAGYPDKMKSVFSCNEGFTRRVTHFFQFDDYTCRDLANILMIKMWKQNKNSRLCGFKLDPACTEDAVTRLMEQGSTEKLRNKMNGGLVDHMLNNARENLDARLTFDSQGDELVTITLPDLEGLEIARICGKDDVVCYTDSLEAVRLLRSTPVGHHKLFPLISVIQHEKLLFQTCEIRHIFREGNQVADALCKRAASKEDFFTTWAFHPDEIQSVLTNDANGMNFLRV